MNSKIFPKIGMIVTLALLIGGGILVWQYLKIPRQVGLPEEGVLEEVVKDEIVDWETYRNEEYGFAMRYPENWYVYPVTFLGENKVAFSNLSKGQIEDMVEKAESEQEFSELENIYSLEIRIVEKSLEDWLRDQERLLEQFRIDFAKEQVAVGENEGYKISAITEEGKEAFSKVLSQGKNTYLIESMHPERCRFEECEIFNQMLSTFRFID